MSLPPLGDLFALSDPDPAVLDATERSLRAAGLFVGVWRPNSEVVVALRDLPGPTTADATAREQGLFVAQGADRIGGDEGAWRRVAALARGRARGLEALTGDFTFLHVTAGGATAVRSAGGVVPLYVSADGERWVVATSLALMLRFHPRRLGLDPLLNAIALTGYDAAIDGRTYLAGVRTVPRGHLVRLGRGGAQPERWWHPRDRAAPQPSPDHVPRLRELLLAGLDRDLDPDGENVVGFSGGVDSSVLAALAAGPLGRTTSTLTAYTPHVAGRALDQRYVDALHEALPFRHRRELLIGAAESLEMVVAETGAPYHVLHPFAWMQPRAAREWSPTVVVGGEFADHTLGSTLTRYDWARHTRLRDIALRRAHTEPPFVLRWWLSQRLRRVLRRNHVPWPADLPAAVRPELREEYREWWEQRRRAAARDHGPLPYLAMYLERDGTAGMYWEVASGLGIRRSTPFAARELLELAFEQHPSELVAPGTKRPLRAALTGLVPEMHLTRRDKGEASLGDAAGAARAVAAAVPDAARPILAPDWPPPAPLSYTDAFRVRQLHAMTAAVDRVLAQRSTDGLRAGA